MTPLLSLVPVPYVPPEPPLPTSASPLGWTLAALSVSAIFGFCVIVIRAILNIPFRKNEVKLAAWLSFGGIALFAACYVDWRIHHYRQDVAKDTWREARQEADDIAQAALEKKYGITFTDDVLVFPIEQESSPWEMEVDLPDGTSSTCWLRNVDQYFTISCGTDASTAAPLTAAGDGLPALNSPAAHPTDEER